MYYVSVHYYKGANQTSKHKERAFTITLDAYNKWHAEQAAIEILTGYGEVGRISKVQSTAM